MHLAVISCYKRFWKSYLITDAKCRNNQMYDCYTHTRLSFIRFVGWKLSPLKTNKTFKKFTFLINLFILFSILKCWVRNFNSKLKVGLIPYKRVNSFLQITTTVYRGCFFMSFNGSLAIFCSTEHVFYVYLVASNCKKLPLGKKDHMAAL